MGCHFLLQGIFPIQGSNLGLPHCRQTLYSLNHLGSPQYYKKTSKHIASFHKIIGHLSGRCKMLVLRNQFCPGDLTNPGIEPRSLLLLLLSCCSCVQLCAAPQMAAHQAPPSLGFSRQEHWSGLPFPSPMHESEKWKWSRLVVSDSLHCRQILYQLSHKGSPKILEWVGYPFSSGSFWPRNQTGVSCIAGEFFTNWAIREALRIGL